LIWIGTIDARAAAVSGSAAPASNYDLDWHPAPNRQYVVTLSGESEIELEGGRKLRLGPGHILLAEDTTGQRGTFRGRLAQGIASRCSFRWPTGPCRRAEDGCGTVLRTVRETSSHP